MAGASGLDGASVAALVSPPGLLLGQEAPRGDEQGATVGSNYDKATREFIEREILHQFDYMAVDTPVVEEHADASRLWGQILKDLQLLGFHMDAKNGLDKFGLYKFEGPEPDKTTILRRAGLLNDLLGAISDSTLEPAEQAHRAQWLCEVADEQNQCLTELRDVQRERKKMLMAKDRLPRWAEAEAGVLEHIMREVDTESVCMLNLSNVLRSRDPLLPGHHVAKPPEARDIVGKLLQGGQSMETTLRSLSGRGLVLWCPGSREDVGRLCGGVAKAAQHGVRVQIVLVLTLEPRPGCHTAQQFGDTWTHDLLQGRWAPFIKDVRFSPEPVKVVVSGLHAPMHQVKSLSMVTLSSVEGTGRWSMMQPRGSIGQGADYDLIIVDVSDTDEVDLLTRMGRVPVDIVSAWSGPTRAASSAAGSKCIIYTGRLTQGGGWAARVSLLQVKEVLQGVDAIIGLHSTYSNAETILIDVTCPAAALKVQAFLEDAVLVTPGLLIARSTASEAQWRQRVEDIFKEQDDAYVERVRYRPSEGGGIITAAPALTEQKELKKYIRLGSDGKELQVVLRLVGEYIGARLDEVSAFVKMMAEASQVPLLPQAVEVVTEAFQWKPMLDARYGWKGYVLTRVNTTEEVIRIFRTLDGKAINVAGGGKIVIEVIPHVSLVEAARNAGGAQPGR